MDLNLPASGTKIHPDYAKAIGRFAYIWGWPLVNMYNRRATITQAPAPGLLDGVLPVAPRGQLAMLNDYVKPNQRFVACPNQDVAYGLGLFALDEEPAVVQVPDFGDRFFVYAMYDARTDQFGEIGKAYGTKSGFYLLVGPNWDGDVPDGVNEVFRSPTELALVGPRCFMDDTDEDRAAIKPLVNQILAYPLTEFDGTWRTTDWDGLPAFPAPKVEGGEAAWVVPGAFFDQLPAVLDGVPPLPGEEALYVAFRQVLEAAATDAEVAQALVEAATETEEQVIKPIFVWQYNGVPAGNGWNRSSNNAEWGLDYLMRTSTAKSNMFDNRPVETQYFYTDADADSVQLEGKNSYAVTFAAGELPPVRGFWSLTLYNEHHFFEVNDLGRYSLGTKNKTLRFNDDGSLTIYVGATPPGPDKDSNWLPAPDDVFSLYLRSYWGEEAILDGSWRPPRIEKVG